MKFEMLRYNSDFSRAYKRGKQYVHPHIVLYVNKTKKGITRVGITCSKKVGGAVVRNRARRVILHALYEVLPQQAGSVDIVLVARAQTPRQNSRLLAQTLKKLLQNAGIAAKQEQKA